ncbi:tail fiber domain-containing protein [Pseudomonas japonica]|uniref:tail fiber domain-containing protein n=1 Tax=Pseudomonas japonica TaxID=256466 RepID=UPI00380696C9
MHYETASLTGSNGSCERIEVTDYFQPGDTSWSDAFDRVIAVVESRAVGGTEQYTLPDIFLPDHGADYGILRPISTRLPLKFKGEGVRVVALQGFVGKTIPLAAGGTEVNSSMMIFLDGDKGSTTGVVRNGAAVGKGITLDCHDTAYNGIYIERMTYATIDCEIQFPADSGVQIGPHCWGMSMYSPVIENFSNYAVRCLPHSACNGMSIVNPRFWGEFKIGNAGILFDKDAECNGFHVSGGFIEKVNYGVIVAAGNGPIVFTGVDFEQCQVTVVRAATGDFTGKVIGPLTLDNCVLHSISAVKVYADEAIIHVRGCRLFPDSFDFETDSFGRGVIHASNNRYDAGFVNAPNANLVFDDCSGLTRNIWNYLPNRSNNFYPALDVRNFQFPGAKFLQSSGFSFYSNHVDGPAGQTVSRSDWWVSEYHHKTAPGVLNKVIGVRLANDAGQNSFQPMVNNATTCGAPGASWAGGSTQVAFTVVSDEREKQQLQEISDVERRVAAQCKLLLGLKYKLNDQVAKLGDKAKWHFGTSAQRVIAAFEAEGLDAMDYSVVEYHEWDEIEPVTDKDGTITLPGQPAGNVYTVNYEELQAFVLSVI